MVFPLNLYSDRAHAAMAPNNNTRNNVVKVTKVELKKYIEKSTLENIFVNPTRLKVSSVGKERGSLKIALLFLNELLTKR
tara:strand:+ start:933 stop:1172 length:240 start_codon:yes stop_codon:yes gene_type:complete